MHAKICAYTHIYMYIHASACMCPRKHIEYTDYRHGAGEIERQEERERERER